MTLASVSLVDAALRLLGCSHWRVPMLRFFHWTDKVDLAAWSDRPYSA
ncbi:hypothetical protein [Leptolyngbya ohadii]|nr:hypothetical protein [Leptolyngbya ohadii]